VLAAPFGQKLMNDNKHPEEHPCHMHDVGPLCFARLCPFVKAAGALKENKSICGQEVLNVKLEKARQAYETCNSKSLRRPP
jgi:hypothetical protein